LPTLGGSGVNGAGVAAGVVTDDDRAAVAASRAARPVGRMFGGRAGDGGVA
jgi:hypothetical protein